MSPTTFRVLIVCSVVLGLAGSLLAARFGDTAQAAPA